jgi:hypothetical protein
VELNKVSKAKDIQTIPLNLSLYSTQEEFKSANDESIRSVDEVIKII